MGCARPAVPVPPVRLTWNSLHMLDGKEPPLNRTRLFNTARRHGALDRAVLVSKPRGQPLPLRLLIIRKPPQGAPKARQKVRRASQTQHRRRVDPRTLSAADFLILLTSLDETAFPLPQLGALYRVRWQVELTFKRLKSLLHIDQLHAKNADLARLWLHAHLLFALIVEQTVAELDQCHPDQAPNRQKSVWRTVKLVAAARLATIWPRILCSSLTRLLRQCQRQFHEAKRQRKLQCIPLVLC